MTSATDLTTTTNQHTEADWRKRFRGARVTLPQWAERAPDRLIYGSNESGTFELYAWDRANGKRRQITQRREGTLSGTIGPSGELRGGAGGA